MTERHGLEAVDVAAATGVLATVFGASLLFLSTEGRFQTASESPVQPIRADVKDLLEPAIGEAIVTASVIEDKHRGDIAKAAGRLNTELMTAQRLVHSGTEPVEHLVRKTKELEARKESRVEFVKGKSIVNFTSRGKQDHALPSQQWETFNSRMIGAAARQETNIEGACRAARPDMATSLAAEIDSQTAAFRRNQEEVGAAVVRVVTVEGEYHRAMGNLQQQVGSLVSAATMAGL